MPNVALQLRTPRPSSCHRYIFLLPLLLFVAVSHYIVLEVIYLICLLAKVVLPCPSARCIPEALSLLPLLLVTPSQTHHNQTVRSEEMATNLHENSEMWPESGRFRLWFWADQWQTIRSWSHKQKSVEREKPFQSNPESERWAVHPTRVLHSSVLKHSKDHHSQHWEGYWWGTSERC